MSSISLSVLAAGVALMASGCGSRLPTPSPLIPSSAKVTFSGWADDTASRRLVGVTVEMVDGPEAGMSTTTDDLGGFEFPDVGPFPAFTVTLRASKEGYASAATKFRISPGGGCCYVFTLKSLTPAANISGDYLLTFRADSACADLPPGLRTRTYTATITPSSSRPDNVIFQVKVDGATFYRTGRGETNSFAIRASADYVAFELDGEFDPITEELAPLTYLTLTGSAGASIDASRPVTFSTAFAGSFKYCGTKSDFNYPDPCAALEPSLPHAACASKNHTVTLTPR